MSITFFDVGIALSLCVLLFSLYLLWCRRSSCALMLACFVALFGNFVFAPRMHERYLYPTLIFLVPAALEQPAMMGLFAAVSPSPCSISVTCFTRRARLEVSLCAILPQWLPRYSTLFSSESRRVSRCDCPANSPDGGDLRNSLSRLWIGISRRTLTER